MSTSIYSSLFSLKIIPSKLENILINSILWTKYKRRKEGNLSSDSQSVSYFTRDTGKSEKGRINEGIDKSSLDSLPFLLHTFFSAPMLRPEGSPLMLTMTYILASPSLGLFLNLDSSWAVTLHFCHWPTYAFPNVWLGSRPVFNVSLLTIQW